MGNIYHNVKAPLAHRSFAKEAKEINKEHNALLTQLTSIGVRAARIGEILAAVKEGLPHGQWEDWVSGNLDFGERQAQMYMQFHAKVEGLDCPTRALLADEWRELSNPKTTPKAQYTALLPPAETEDLKRTEGAVEDDEKATGDTKKAEIETPAEPPKPAQKPPKPTPRDPEIPKDAAGRAIPKNLRAVFEKSEQFKCFAQTVSTLKGQVRQAIEADPVVWSQFSENAFRAALDKCHDLLCLSGPHIVCPYCGGDQPENCKGCKGSGFLSKAQARCVPEEMRR